MKRLKQKTVEEIIAAGVGVHAGNELLNRGAVKRCKREEADITVRRAGIFRSYYLLIVPDMARRFRVAAKRVKEITTERKQKGGGK